MEKEKVVQEEIIEDQNLDGNDGSFTMPEKSKSKKGWWKRKTKGQKVSFIFALVVLVISLAVFFLWVYCRNFLSTEAANALLGYYIDVHGEIVYYNDGWQRIAALSINIAFKLILSLFVIAFTIIIAFLFYLLIHLLTSNKSRKSQTIGSLLKSLVKYISILVDIAIILVLFGVDVIGVVAGVGVLTLVIGLGCQTLIQDIISGLFIVFDDYFAVGDIVIIDGFRGTITEVGLKTTKLQDPAGNIKSISNSQITTVANLSRYDTMICVNIPCAYEEDIIRVEAIMAEAMPEIGKKIPNITKGPFYKGIDKITASSYEFMVLCYAKEANRFQVVRDLNKELILLFREHDIIIPYQQVVVNEPHDKNRKRANERHLEASKKATKELREEPKVDDSKKNKSLIRKVKKSVTEATNELLE